MSWTQNLTPEKDGIFCSLIVPCYNEERNLAPFAGAFSAALKNTDIEVILVNNGSTDGSAAVLGSLLREYPFLRSVAVPVNRGYGHGILEGLKAARGTVLGWAHGDLQYSPGDLAAAAEELRPLRHEKFFYKGLRRGRPVADRIFTSGMAFFESALLGLRLSDINAQPTFFHRSLTATFAVPPEDFSLDLYAYACAVKNGFKVRRGSITLKERAAGTSSWNRGLGDRVKLIKRTIAASLTIRKELARPGRQQ